MPWAGAKPPAEAGALQPPELPAVPSALPALGVTPALGPPKPPAPNPTHPGHEVPNQANSSHRGGWLRPPLRDATPSSAQGSPASPHPGGQVGALLESRCPGEESRLPPVPPAPLPGPQPCSCIPGLQNLLEILQMQILASRPCQELELQSQEGSRLQARRPPRSPSPSLGNPL